uniref:Uncharacterized protein n=1 Tax=Onchocerca volvulus TaxID=6282 RepID=A0A8R1XYW5_ONCVO
MGKTSSRRVQENAEKDIDHAGDNDNHSDKNDVDDN